MRSPRNASVVGKESRQSSKPYNRLAAPRLLMRNTLSTNDELFRTGRRHTVRYKLKRNYGPRKVHMLRPFARIAAAFAIAPLALIALGFALAVEATVASRRRAIESADTKREYYFDTRARGARSVR